MHPETCLRFQFDQRFLRRYRHAVMPLERLAHAPNPCTAPGGILPPRWTPAARIAESAEKLQYEAPHSARIPALLINRALWAKSWRINVANSSGELMTGS